MKVGDKVVVRGTERKIAAVLDPKRGIYKTCGIDNPRDVGILVGVK